MTILYHHRTLADGAEGIHIAEMVAAFRGLGHDVHVRGLASSHASDGHSKTLEQVKAMLPSAAFEGVSVLSNVVEYLDVRRAIRALRPDFLYKRHARHDIGALEAARASGVPAVLEVNCLFTGAQYHQFEPIAFRRIARRLERRALELADVVLAVSTPLSKAIVDISPARVAVLPNGADPIRFDPARADGLRVRALYAAGDDLTIGWAGVMREWHGLELLLDAVATLPGVRLMLVGDGPARAAVERHAAAQGFADRVVITGRVTPQEMPDYLAAMDIAVVAHDGTGIASPMKLVEYMAMERAVVAPRLDNIQDLVQDEHNGLLFTPESASSLAVVLRRLTADRALRASLGREARQTVVRDRTWRANAERVVTLVEHAVASRPPQAA
jgi:glycosyltransferase involved in cell wall biosynthesis